MEVLFEKIDHRIAESQKARKLEICVRLTGKVSTFISIVLTKMALNLYGKD